MLNERELATLSLTAQLAAAAAGVSALARGITPLLGRADADARVIAFGPQHLALVLIGALLLLAAVSGRRLAAAYRATGVIALNCIVLLAVLELASSRLVHDEKPAGPPAPRDLFGRGRDSIALDSAARDTIPVQSLLPYYRGQDWAAEHWRELRDTKADYHPYVLWRRAPFRGRTITVNNDGVRATPGTDCRPGAYTVFVLGGSTVWGYGVPDWATIPAYLAQELRARRGAPVCVVNLGELGFNSTQDLIELIRQLQAGHVPDLVIFYQGINDVWTAAQAGKPGLHFYLEEIAGRLEGDAGPSSGTNWLARSNMFRFAAQHALRRDPPAGARLPGYMAKRWIAPDSLSAQVERLYLQNYTMVDALARAYGFTYGMFWQPNLLVGKKPLGSEELAFQRRESEQGEDWMALMNRAYARVAEDAPRRPHLHFMGNVFDADSTVLYSDWAHLNPVGNQRVARLIIAALGNAFTTQPLATLPPKRVGAGQPGGDQ